MREHRLDEFINLWVDVISEQDMVNLSIDKLISFDNMDELEEFSTICGEHNNKPFNKGVKDYLKSNNITVLGIPSGLEDGKYLVTMYLYFSNDLNYDAIETHGENIECMICSNGGHAYFDNIPIIQNGESYYLLSLID